VAQVVCKQLGYTVGRLLELSIVNDGTSTNQIWLDNVSCTGSENKLEDCSHADSGKWQWGTLTGCSHTNDIGIGCDANDGSSDNGAYPGIRLKNNSNVITNSLQLNYALQGRVEVRKNGVWGTICNDQTNEYK